MTQFSDLADRTEDERIAIIAATAAGALVGFIVPDDATADRYLHKLGSAVRLLGRHAGPFPGTVFVRVGPVLH